MKAASAMFWGIIYLPYAVLPAQYRLGVIVIPGAVAITTSVERIDSRARAGHQKLHLASTLNISAQIA